MNKRVILLFAVIFGAVGSYVPMLWGDANLFGGWSILFGMIGGFVGIWLGVVISKRWS